MLLRIWLLSIEKKLNKNLREREREKRDFVVFNLTDRIYLSSGKSEQKKVI